MSSLKNIFSIVVAVVVLSTAALATKPEIPGVNGKAYGHMSKEGRMAAILAAKNAKVRSVTKSYMYPDATGTDTRYDYDEDAWGKLLVKYKKDMVKFHGHNLEANKEYELFYDGKSIGEKTMSNDEGNLRINASFDIPEDYDRSKFVLKQGDSTKLVSRVVRLRGEESED